MPKGIKYTHKLLLIVYPPPPPPPTPNGTTNGFMHGLTPHLKCHGPNYQSHGGQTHRQTNLSVPTFHGYNGIILHQTGYQL